jgi:hypothetical protein
MNKTNEFKPHRVHWHDIEELACHILDLDYDEVDYSEIEEAIYEKFDCSFETFQDIVEHLIPLADSGKSPLSGEVFQGFSKDEGDGLRCWIVKSNPL